jgi:PPIC-type PPIASE domain
MIRTLMSLVLASAAVWGQTQGTTPAPKKPSSAGQASTPRPASAPAADKPAANVAQSGSAVAPTAAVITVKGVCKATAARKAAGATGAASAPCTTVVTKAQFDKLMDALNSGNQTIAPAMRRNLAQAYVELLAYTQAAERAGTENDSRFLEIMHLMRMRSLADIYRRNLEEKYRNPPAAEVQAAYNQNISKYEEIKLSRIFIPAKNPSAQVKDDWEKKAAQTANDMRERAAKGEDFEKLQKEAYTTLGLTITPPTTTVGARRRGMLAPQEEQELFALSPGGISKVEQQPAGYIIYKVESKQTLPMEQVKDEISREIFRKSMETQQKKVTAQIQAEFNEQYFGPVNAPGPGGMQRPPVPPGAAETPANPAPKPSVVPPTPPAAAPAASTPPASAPPASTPASPPASQNPPK